MHERKYISKQFKTQEYDSPKWAWVVEYLITGN